MQEDRDIQIFLSYASQDKDRVLPFYDFLIKNGYPNTWIDCKKLLPGQPWELEIDRNLRKSEIVIVFLSNISVDKRGFVQRELKRTVYYLEEKLNDDIYIIPIKLDAEIIIPDKLTGIQYLDANEPAAFGLLKLSLDQQSSKLGFYKTDNEHNLDSVFYTKRIFREDWDGLPGYNIEYSIPIFHSTEFDNIIEVSKIIEARHITALHLYRENKLRQFPKLYSWFQESFRRIKTYESHYDYIYQEGSFLSIVYNVSWYETGAAHPNYHFETYNFLLNPVILIDSIEKLFITPDNTLFEYLVSLIRQQLLSIVDTRGYNDGINSTEMLLSSEWVIRGTEDWDSINCFSFNDKGLVIHFPPYQVGAYSEGSHRVTILYELITDYLAKDFKHALNVAFR